MDTLVHMGLSNAVAAGLLAIPAALCSRLARRPALAHALWLLVLIKLLTPPLWPVAISWPLSPSSGPQGTEVLASSSLEEPWAQEDVELPESPIPRQPEADHSQPTEPAPMAPSPAAKSPVRPHFLQTIFASSPYLAALWILGSFLWWMLVTRRLRRFHQLLRFARPADAALQQRAKELARRLGLESCPEVWVMPGQVSPMLGMPRAKIFLPIDLLQRLSGCQRDALLVHELAHLRRRDHWVRFLELLATGLYWWHPVTWWACWELREAEEQCCDAWVVWALPAAARGYAIALMETVDFLSETRPVLPPAVSGMGHVRDLKRRMAMILRGTTPRALSWSGFLAVVGMGALLLPLGPTIGQTPREKEALDEVKRAEEELKKATKRLEEARKARDAASDPLRSIDQTSCLRCHQPIVHGMLSLHELANVQKSHAAVSGKYATWNVEPGRDAGWNVEIGKVGTWNTDPHGDVLRLAAEIQKQQAASWETRAKFEEALRLLEEQTRSKEKDKPARGGQTDAGPGGKHTEENKAAQEKHLGELSRQVEKLLQEVEALRREIRKGQTEKPGR